MKDWSFRMLNVSIALLFVCTLFLAFWISARLRFTPTSVAVAEVVPLIVLIGVIAALMTFAARRVQEASREYLDSATDLLSKAYSTLADKRDDLDRPKADRLNWLTAARLVVTSGIIASRITEESHLSIWRQQQEYWRGRIRDLIFPDLEGHPPEYFAEDPAHMDGWVGTLARNPLSEKSLAVLYEFIKWPEGMLDPLPKDAKFSDAEIQRMVTFGPRGLGRFLESVRALRKRV